MQKEECMLSEYQIQRLLDTANAGCHKGLPVAARIVYESILILKPGFPPAVIGQALSHIVVDEFIQAEEILEDYLQSNPDDADAQVFLGLSYMFSNKDKEAHALLEQAVANDGAVGIFASDVLKLMDGSKK